MGVLTLTVNPGNEIPDDGKERPGANERGKEVEYRPRPWEVDRGDEQIFQNPEMWLNFKRQILDKRYWRQNNVFW